MSDGPFSIGLPETSVVILPGGGGTQRLARLIGSSRALDLILHARLLTPSQALDFGIVNKLVAHENFYEELILYCSDLVARAPIALRQVKKIIHHGLDVSLEEGLMMEQKAFDVTMRSNDAAKAMRALLDAEKNIDEKNEFEWEGK
jgi:enoyl-CoA hydratase